MEVIKASKRVFAGYVIFPVLVISVLALAVPKPAFAAPEPSKNVETHLEFGVSVIASVLYFGMPEEGIYLGGATLVNNRHEFRYGVDYRFDVYRKFLEYVAPGFAYSTSSLGLNLGYAYRPANFISVGPVVRYGVDKTKDPAVRYDDEPRVDIYSAGGQVRWYITKNKSSIYFTTAFSQYMQQSEILLKSIEVSAGVSLRLGSIPFLSR